MKEQTDEEYLQAIEKAAHKVVEAACEEESFEIFVDDFTGEDDKTALQQAITELACKLRFTHCEGDGCLENHSKDHK